MTLEHKPQRWKRSAGSRRAHKPVEFEGYWMGEEVAEAYPPHPGRRMSEDEYVDWCGERTRAEWVNGEVILMSPITYDHDHIQGWLYRLISDFVEDRDLGDVCSTEFWLRLPNVPSRRLTDLFFVAKGREAGFQRLSSKKSGPATCFNGAADLVLEVVSPDSVERDYAQKFAEYQAAGVREYWIIDPMEKQAVAYERVKGKFRRIPSKNHAIHSKVLDGFFIRPEWLWQSPLPKKRAILDRMNAP